VINPRTEDHTPAIGEWATFDPTLSRMSQKILLNQGFLVEPMIFFVSFHQSDSFPAIEHKFSN